MRILVIEDDATLGRALQEYLTDQGYVVDWVDDGQQGMDVLQHHQYDLSVLDLSLPGIDGLQILTTLRGKGNNTPVLILTARDGLQDLSLIHI